MICGYYNDAAGVSHGFVAKVNLAGNGKPNTNTRKAPVKPAYVLPEVSGIAMPALYRKSACLDVAPSIVFTR